MFGKFDYKKMHLYPDNYLACLEEKDCKDYLYIMPVGLSLNNEMSDVHYIEGAFVPYHIHSWGYETFSIDRGAVRVTICGKQCVAHEGDILHIMPHTPHGFTMLEEGTIWRELFSQMDMNNGIMEKRLLESGSPEKLDDPDFMAEYRLHHGTVRLEEPAPELINKEQMPQVRVKGSALSEYCFGGVTCKLKVGRWEFGGEKEIWEYTFDKPYVIEWDTPHPHWNLFVVREGRVRVEAAGETFTAQKRDIINIPPYTRHRFTILDPGTVLQDNNCKAMMLRLLETLGSWKANAVGKLGDEEALRALFTAHGCAVSSIAKA